MEKIKKLLLNIFEKFKMNIRLIITESLAIAGVAFALVSTLTLFLSWEELEIADVSTRSWIFVGIIVTSLFLGVSHVMIFKKYKKIWEKGNNSVSAIYDDLFKIGFKNKNKKRIVVIPVNDCFDTIVDEANAEIQYPLVCEDSLHGIWVKRFCKEFKCDYNELSSKIKRNLEIRKIKPSRIYTESEKIRGSRESYDIGTVAQVDAPNGTKYFLLVISTFDSKNNAQSNRKKIRDAVDCLMSYYDIYGENESLYVPLMGTGKSRADLSHQQSLRLIKSNVLTQSKITGDITIVVYNGDRDKVSIFKE